MVRKCTEKDRELLLEYLCEEAVYNTFILADIRDFGFSEDFQTVYADFDGAQIKGVYLCFYKNLIIYCKDKEVNKGFLSELFQSYMPDVVMGKSDNVKAVNELLSFYNFAEKDLYLLKDGTGLMAKNEEIQKAQLEDVDEIFDFLQSIPELKGLYTSKDMIEDRISKNLGTHYIVRSRGKIVAHGNSAAESRLTTMVGGVGTAEEYRGKGLASQIVSALAKDILENGKAPCLFATNTKGDNLFENIGFDKVGQWGTLTKANESNKQLPAYIALYNSLYQDIVNGVYEKDSILPSENILSEKYGVSRNTLRQALAILNQDGYIYKKQGRGTVVSYDKCAKKNNEIRNFIIDDALEDIVSASAYYNFGAPTLIAREKLKLKEGEQILASNNVYDGEEGPIGQSFVQIPMRILDKVGIDCESERELLELMNKTIYDLACRADMTIQTMEVDEQVAPYLKIEPRTIVLHIKQLLYDEKNIPIARIKYYFCSGKYQIQYSC